MHSLKKFFLIPFIAIAFVGCSDNSETVIASYDIDSGNHQEDSDQKSSNSGIKYSSSQKNSSSSRSSSKEHDPTDFYIRFITDQYEAQKNVPVRIWSLKENGLQLVDTDTLDGNGKFYPNPSLSGFHLVETTSKDYSSMMWVDFKKGKDSFSHYATKTTSLKGIIKNKGKGIANATVRIFNKETKTDVDGKFEIAGLPQGIHFITVKYNNNECVYIAHTNSESTDEKVLNEIDISDGTYTTIDDFVNWDTGRTNFGNTFGYGFWFYYTDSEFGGKSKITNKKQNGLNDYFVNDSEKGYSLHIVFDIDEDSEKHFGTTGFTLGDDSERDSGYSFFDISQAKALTFDIKGSGMVYVQFIQRSTDGTQDKIQSAPIILSEKWESIALPISENNLDLSSVNMIAFLVNADAEIYLNNIRLEGFSPSQWLSRVRKF